MLHAAFVLACSANLLTVNHFLAIDSTFLITKFDLLCFAIACFVIPAYLN